MNSDRIALMTNGPEARLAECVEANIPRPRSRETLIDTPEYTRLRNHILHFLLRGAHVLAAQERESAPCHRHPLPVWADGGR